ncbi:MAG: hypothetical protein JJT82_10780 [Legionellaceae bacterium]|nr:hypothetical protein [Legionellaceae bacterium]
MAATEDLKTEIIEPIDLSENSVVEPGSVREKKALTQEEERLKRLTNELRDIMVNWQRKRQEDRFVEQDNKKAQDVQQEVNELWAEIKNQRTIEQLNKAGMETYIEWATGMMKIAVAFADISVAAVLEFCYTKKKSGPSYLDKLRAMVMHRPDNMPDPGFSIATEDQEGNMTLSPTFKLADSSIESNPEVKKGLDNMSQELKSMHRLWMRENDLLVSNDKIYTIKKLDKTDEDKIYQETGVNGDAEDYKYQLLEKGYVIKGDGIYDKDRELSEDETRSLQEKFNAPEGGFVAYVNEQLDKIGFGFKVGVHKAPQAEAKEAPSAPSP